MYQTQLQNVVVAEACFGKGCAGWFALAFPAVAWEGIWNLATVTRNGSLILHGDIIWDLERSTDASRRDAHLTSIRGVTHTLMNQPTCETVFITWLRFKPW